MATRRLPAVTQTDGSRTATESGVPEYEDQIRSYRNDQRRRHIWAGRGRRLLSIMPGVSSSERTLEMQMNPEVQLQRSMNHRAEAVPAEVLYRTFHGSVNHRVYSHRSEERMMVVNGSQVDRSFIQESSFEVLSRTGIEFIHIGVMLVRIQILHRKFAGTMALIVFRDTRWSDDRAVLAAMEIDLSEGNQIVYVLPDIMMTIKSFYRHIQICVMTKGYDGWQGEDNLLITRGLTGRLSNTSNVGFAYDVKAMVEHLQSNGVKAIKGEKWDAKRFHNGQWNIEPSKVVVPMQPTEMKAVSNYDGTTSLRFSNYAAASTSKPPQYNEKDEEINEDEQEINHSLNLILNDEESTDEDEEYYQYQRYAWSQVGDSTFYYDTDGVWEEIDRCNDLQNMCPQKPQHQQLMNQRL
nr:circular genome protein 3 - Commelina yellow mottle virus [Commelina yellow mottle virus]